MARHLSGLLVPALLVLAAFSVLIALGNWQVRRLAWKEDLVARATERPNGPIEPLPPASNWTDFNIAEGEYRPYRAVGHFRHDKEALVFTSLPNPKGSFGGPGYWIVTPFVLNDGGTVLVNRGFVPQGRHQAAERPEPRNDGDETTTGLMRPNEPHNFLLPENDPEKNIFFARNIEELAAAKKLAGPIAPFTLDLVAAETPPGGLPQAGETRISFPNNHLQYAVTWYGLAAALAAVSAAFFWRRWKGESFPRALTPPQPPS
jgi:surfeit locus 1 family protein